jgi:hypothetical protein
MPLIRNKAPSPWIAADADYRTLLAGVLDLDFICIRLRRE